VVFPSFVIISIIAALISSFADNVWVMHALAGIRVVVCVLVLNAVIKLFKSGVKDKVGIAVFIAALALMVVFSPSPVIIVAASGVLGALLYGRKEAAK
jgi:chromate transporter